MKFSKIFLAVLFVCAGLSNAEASKDRGGGDLCEKRILEVADDISAWIKAGGAAELKFPADVTLEQYSSDMTAAIDSARVRCVKQGDEGYPVRVGNTPKVCRFDRTETEQLITCDYETFMSRTATSESDQYVLVHHEYAGLAGVENPEGEVSTYHLSNQITDFLEDVVIKRLAVKPAKQKPTPIHPACTIETMLPAIEEGIKNYIRYTFKPISPNGNPWLDVDYASVKVVYRGMLDYQDHDFRPNKGLIKEHAFEVTFKSTKGTNFTIVSFNADIIKTIPPLYAVFSIPEFSVKKKYDSERNVIGLTCVVNTHPGYNRNALFFNTSSGEALEHDLISYSFPELAKKDIE